MPTRNGILARGRFAGKVSSQVGLVPAGTIWLVKLIGIDAAVPTAQEIQVYAVSANGQTLLHLFRQSMQPNAFQLYQIWVPLEPGDTVQLVYTSGTVDCWLGGAALPVP